MFGPDYQAPPLLAAGQETSLEPRWVVAWLVLGVLGFAVLFSTTGGPIHFIRNLSNEGAMTRGRTYFIFAGMALVWVPQAMICARWFSGRAAGWPLLGAMALALVLTATLGARELLAVPLIELALFYWTVRRQISGRTAAAVFAVALLVIVFVVGMVKSYGNYVAQHPGTKVSRLDFMFTKGPADFAHSYAINTADGVALIGLGEHVVPAHAPPELGKEFLRLALQVIPSSARPKLHTAPAIAAAIYPSTTDVYAQPMQLVAYLQFELPGVIVAFLLVGAAAAEIDRRLLSRAHYRLSTLLLLVALATAVSMLLRNAAAPATADTIVEVVGIWAVARTAERPPAGQCGEPCSCNDGQLAMSASSAPFSPDRVLGASLWRMTFLLVQGGGSVVLAASLGHILDARMFATTLLVQGVLVIAQTIGDFGLAQATVTMLPAWIARSPESARRLLASASRAYLYAAGAAMVLTVISAALVPEAARVAILVSAPAAAATVIVAGADGLLRSQGEFRRPVLFVAASEIGGFAGIPVAVATQSAVWTCVAISAGTVVGATGALLALRARLGGGVLAGRSMPPTAAG